LNFVASAHLLDHVEAVNLTEAGQKLLSNISHPVLRQSVRDYFVNQQFRRDIFAKGYRRLTPLEQNESFRQQSFVLLMNANDVPMKVAGSLGEANLQEEIYRPVIQALADNGYAPKTLAHLAGDPRLSSISAPQLAQVLLVLTGAGYVHPAQEPSKRARANCAAMNRFVCERTRSSPEISFLASPVSGSGIVVSMFQQLFLLAAQQGRRTPKEQATFVWDLVRAQGRQVIKDGNPLQSPEENLDELTRQATDFTEKRLPVLKALGIT
jgi:Predicted methyltransferase regulatory domain